MEDIAKTIGMLVAVLIAIIIGVMVYWNVADTGQTGQVVESFACDNSSNLTATIQYDPHTWTLTDFVPEFLNSSSGVYTAIPATNWSRSGRTITFEIRGTNGSPPIYSPFYDANTSAARFSYYTDAGVNVRDNINPQASTVFTLAPIIAIVIIASVILGVVMVFGKKPGGGI